jgi:hypothetical protein
MCAWWRLPWLPQVQALPFAAHHHANLPRWICGDGGVGIADAAISKDLDHLDAASLSYIVQDIILTALFFKNQHEISNRP